MLDKKISHTNYFQPDSKWDLPENSTSPNKFVQNHVVHGHFHSGVPEDILLSFETAEHLMAYSYFYWPLYDEALRKILGIFEMAVKLRAKELGIKTKSEKGSVHLSSLIDQLIKKGFPRNRKLIMDWIRRLRNYHSHPERHNFMGGSSKYQIIPIVNTINELFYSYSKLKENEHELKRIQRLVASFNDTCFVLETSGKRFLIHRIQPRFVLQKDESLVNIIAFYPILENADSLLKNHAYPEPFTVAIKDCDIEINLIQGVDVSDACELSVYITDNQLDMNRFNEYWEAYHQLSETDKMIMDSFQDGTILHHQHNLVYSFGWE
ncbi:MAG: hypothetical protein H6606_11405 [Flavobacteriales bacterium]|nr:hypothetical protein [Flavobacteriales bacterium]